MTKIGSLIMNEHLFRNDKINSNITKLNLKEEESNILVDPVTIGRRSKGRPYFLNFG